MSIELETRIDNLIRQNAALAAENERLQGIIDEAQDQEPACKIIRNEAGQVSIKNGQGDYFDMSKYVGFSLFAAPIPAQQSPAIPNGAYESKCSCGSFFFGVKNQPFCAKCYDEKLRAQQSPAVAVPDEMQDASIS